MSKNHRISSIASGQAGITIFRGDNARMYIRYFHINGPNRVIRIIQENLDCFHIDLFIDGWQAYRIRGDEEA